MNFTPQPPKDELPAPSSIGELASWLQGVGELSRSVKTRRCFAAAAAAARECEQERSTHNSNDSTNYYDELTRLRTLRRETDQAILRINT